MNRKAKRVLVVAATATALVSPLATQPASAAPSAPTVVVSGLNNPRQLSLTEDGVLLVAEAGKGGAACGPAGPGGEESCLGFSGSISAVTQPGSAANTKPNRVITGLASGAGKDGSFAVGADGVSARKYKNGSIWIQETYAPTDALPQGVDKSQIGKLLYASPGSKIYAASDVSAYEKKNDPDGKGFDSNPYAVLDLGDHRLVADAAGNSIVSVARSGKITTFHVFGNIKSKTCTTATAEFPGYDPTPAFPGCNFVPTSLAAGPNGDIIVGGLASEQPGQAQVVVLDCNGKVKRVLDGFSGVTGVAAGSDGSIYASQLFAPQAKPVNEQIVGVVTKVTKDGKRTNIDVPFPAGLAVDYRNDVYVSAFSVASEAGLAGPGTEGQVWRLRF